MSERPPRYPDWKAPAEDGELLVWPEPRRLLEETHANLARLSRASHITIQNIPLDAVRRRLRQFIGHDDSRPLLASGHQTELYHPGVWVKDALIDAAAKQLDGAAFHIAVDTDAPKHLVLRWPGGAAPISDDANLTTAAWCALLAPPAPAHLLGIAQQFEQSSATWNFQPTLPRVLDSLRRLSLEARDLSSALTNAQHELDWNLGLRHHALLASPIWESEPFLLFAHHILARADKFAFDYNSSLHTYRDEHNIRSQTRPMPDLFASDDSIETPFWLDDLSSGTRSRPSVFRAGHALILQLLGGEQFVLDPQADGWEAASKLARFLTSAAHRLAPRALTLTMFLRLCLVDQFVHGIGGGRYDQVTDRLIARHFGIEPPAFSVTTATLYFPDAVGRPRACVPCVRHEGHRLRHRVLGPRKMRLVEQIDSLPRKSPQRKAQFLAMHNALDAAAREHPSLRRWRDELDEAERRAREEQVLFDRELFYAIQPIERLHDLMGKYNNAFRSPSL